MTKWMEDKNKVKELFDHIRNFIICGALLYASVFSFITAEDYKLGSIVGFVVGVVLFAIFIAMGTANIVQGIDLIFPDIKNKKSFIKKSVQALMFGFYTLCAFQLIDSIYTSKIDGSEKVADNMKPNKSLKEMDALKRAP